MADVRRSRGLAGGISALLAPRDQAAPAAADAAGDRTAAVEYWVQQGMLDRMDADLNGIPCDTVYPPDDVTAYWGLTAAVPDWLAWTLPIAVVVLPFVLMYGFNRGDRADSRGRRISRRWHH